jgi:hypothetical protein
MIDYTRRHARELAYEEIYPEKTGLTRNMEAWQI